MEAARALTDSHDVLTYEGADLAIEIIDQVIKEVYLPFRGAEGFRTERAILPEPPHAPHQENDAEHSWHLAFTVRVLWDCREELGLTFPDNFNIDRAVHVAIFHDIPEIWADDVDVLTENTNLIEYKSVRERAAVWFMRTKFPFLKGVATDWEEYEHKDTYEEAFISDLDKIISTRMICMDGGRRWHNWNGQQASREFMCGRMRQKLITNVGCSLFDAIERDLDNHPEYFPSDILHGQDKLF